MHLLQICNVGDVCGGTAACAWTITRALPECQHSVAFLSRVKEETRRHFGHTRVLEWKQVSPDGVRKLRPDLVLLHNTSEGRGVPIKEVASIQYLHSAITPLSAPITVACSQELRSRLELSSRQIGDRVSSVLYQPVPVPPRPTHWTGETRWLRDRMVVGRICTPTSRKWPVELIPFYQELAASCRSIDWEFVGCPTILQDDLRRACLGRAVFHPASWGARSHLWRWDAMLYHHPTLSETFGRTCAEAMRAGCIPIVDDRGGFREQVTPKTGLLCRQTSEFVTALMTLQSRSRRWVMQRQATQMAHDRFSLQAFSVAFRELLREASGTQS
ncbi:MAG: glycosyltransferase [Planctomycetaceae bacterium]